jgi:hypothetical protein
MSFSSFNLARSTAFGVIPKGERPNRFGQDQPGSGVFPAGLNPVNIVSKAYPLKFAGGSLARMLPPPHTGWILGCGF